MTLFLNQNEHDTFSSVSQGNFQDRESLFHHLELLNPTLFIKSNQDYFTILYNCGWILNYLKLNSDSLF